MNSVPFPHLNCCFNIVPYKTNIVFGYILAASSQNSRPEKRSLTWESRDTPLTRDDGSDSSYGQELFQKLDKLESVMENQRKFLEDHDIKIQEIENVVNKIMKDKRRQEEDQIETTGEKDHRMKLVPRALSSSGARGSFLLPSPREVSKHDFLRQRPATLSWLHFTT